MQAILYSVTNTQYEFRQTSSLSDLQEAGCAREQSFLKFYEERALNDRNLRQSTRVCHLSTLKHLKSFAPELRFKDLTYQFLVDFENYLISISQHRNTIAKHIKHLRRQVNAAVNKGFLEEQHNPFRNYRIKMIPGHHTHLTPEELTKLELFRPLETHRNLYHVLDAFLFCCYAGLRYSDFTSLSPANIVDIGQERWLIYHSVKTGTEVRLPLFVLFGGKALGILEKYQNRLEDFFRLGDNSNTNKLLRLIGQMAGVDTPISFHTARHTNATLLIYKGRSMSRRLHAISRAENKYLDTQPLINSSSPLYINTSQSLKSANFSAHLSCKEKKFS